PSANAATKAMAAAVVPRVLSICFLPKVSGRLKARDDRISLLIDRLGGRGRIARGGTRLLAAIGVHARAIGRIGLHAGTGARSAVTALISLALLDFVAVGVDRLLCPACAVAADHRGAVRRCGGGLRLGGAAGRALGKGNARYHCERCRARKPISRHFVISLEKAGGHGEAKVSPRVPTPAPAVRQGSDRISKDYGAEYRSTLSSR